MKNFYKKLSFVMVMGISFSSYAAWNGDATAWTQGDGSEQNPFLIDLSGKILPPDRRFRHGWQANAFDWSL